MEVFNLNFFSDPENDGAAAYSLGVFKTLEDAQNKMYEHVEEIKNLLMKDVVSFNIAEEVDVDTFSNTDKLGEYDDGEIHLYKAERECAFTFFLDFYEWKITSWEI